MMDFARPAGYRTRNCTLIAGDEDDYVDADTLSQWTREAAPAANVETVRGADHFFSGAHTELARAVERAFR